MKEKYSFKDLKKNLFNNIGKDKILILIMAGVLLVIISIPTKSSDSLPKASSTSTNTNINDTSTLNYEELLESKIKRLLAKVEGVGKVEIMVTLKASSEKVLVSQGSNSENIVKESDSDGGVRESREKTDTNSYLYSDGGSGSQPYVAQEIKPEVEGVMVIAQGGSDSTVVLKITNAIEALLSVPVHKIKVLQMVNGQ